MINLLNDTDCIIDKTGDQVATLKCIPPIFANVIFWLLVFAGVVALVLIIFSGIKFITSSGDQKQAEGARKTLTYAIGGLVLILLSFAILRFIAETTGVGCITQFGFTNCQPEDTSKPCSRTNPSGFCSGGRECLSTLDRPGDVRCQYRCSKDHTGGWCPGGKTCERSIAPDLTSYWSCR